MEATPKHIAAIHSFLDALARRERTILGARSGLWLLCAVSGGLLIGALAFSSGASRVVVGTGMLLGLLLYFGLVAVRGLRPQWRRAGTLRWQAKRVEARLPGLRSRMITVVDLSVEVAAGTAAFSTELWARAAAHAQAATRLIRVSDIHPWSRVRRGAAALCVLLLACLLAGRILPVGPLGALDILMGKSAAAVRLEAATAASAEDRAVVGDITLRYIYPDYMGMDPIRVPNSDGTIHAPPGTRVQISARTAEVFDAAAIQVDQNEPLDAGLTDGRDLSADITIQMDGTWRFMLFSGSEVETSLDYKILVASDQPPVVVASEAGEATRAVDEPLGISWQVTDDYGIASVTLEIIQDGEMRSVQLRQPIDPVAELAGGIRKTPRALGLKPGDTVRMRIAALDSDQASGGNRGESEEIVLTVMGPRGIGKRLTAYHRRLRAALLGALADFLEEPVPPAQSARSMLRWARDTRGRLDPVREVYVAQWGDEQSEALDGVVVREVMDRSGRLYRFTVVTFDIADANARSGRKAVERDYTTFVELHAQTVDALERAVWVIDEMLQQVAYREIARMVGNVADEAKDLAAMAAEDAEPQALLARLDRLQRLMSKLHEASSRLSEGQFKQFLNSQMDEAQGRMDAIRQAIAQGRLDEAQRMLDELAEQLSRFAEGMQEQMSRSKQGDNELAERLKKLVEDLELLGTDQEGLADELAKAREAHGGDLDELMAQWERLDTLAAQAVVRTDGILARIGDGRGWSARTIRRAEITGQEVHGTQDAVRARDPRGALERVYGSHRYQMMIERDLRREEASGGAPGVREAADEARRLGIALQEMRTILEQMREQPQSSSPELEAAARQLSSRQGAVRERQQRLAEEVQTVERAMPTGDGSAQDNMRGAGSAMDDASESLQRGEAMAGEGHQREAKRRLDKTKQSLEQAAQRQQQMQQQMQRMEGEGEGGKPHTGETPTDPMAQPEIPAPESFKTPEAYRRALLEGMAEDVPEEFQALKKRFYEELVRQ
jgi:tetratricopeptide (TPR) repeat protein